MSPAQLQQQLQQAIVHHRAGRLEDAALLYRRVRTAAPRNFDAVQLSGVVELQLGRPAEAIALLTRALTLSPQSHVCLMRLGLAHMAAGDPQTAETELKRALQLKPDFVEAWDNYAYCLKAQDRLKEALECHRRATTLNPRSASSWYNYGLTLSLYGRIGDALQCHQRALHADPQYAKAHYGRAQALQQAHRIPEAIQAYGEYLKREPRHFEAHSYRLFALNYLDDISREQLFAEHRKFGEAVGLAKLPAFTLDPAPDRPLRVGILSPDLRNHSCAYFLEPLLEHLDPEQFEVYLYHDHFREDAVSQRLKSCARSWRNFVGQPNPAVEAALRSDQLDILIDLAGHTGMTNRLPVFARHIAPVQITYLGYPNTTGLPAIGYRFTDAVADPPGEADAFATEQLVRFAPTAWAYRPSEHAPDVAPLPCGAGAEVPVTFGCFNNLAKVNDTTLQLWARLLAAVPHSRLVLKGRELGEDSVRQRYAARFVSNGLPPERITLLERTAETQEHLALYHQIDVALDTFPYHGTTTTCEALWMGVPVVTMMGDRHVSRVSASLLSALGHPEWIAHTPEEYVRIGVQLATDRAALAAVRSGLRAEMQGSPLLDHAGQAARFGAALRSCWQAWCETRTAVAQSV